MGRGRVRAYPPSTYLPLATLSTRSIACNELVCPPIAPFNHTVDLFIGPGIEIHGLNSTDVCAHSTVDTRAPDTNKDT